MAHSIKKRLRGMVVAFAAALVALAIAPTAVLAEPAVMTGGKLMVITDKGDNIELYKIVDIMADDASNQISYGWADGITDDTFGMTLDQYLAVADGNENVDSDAERELGDKIFQVIEEGEFAPAATGTVTGGDYHGQTFFTFDNLESGQYLVVINNENDPTRMYPATITTVAPMAVDGKWVMPSDEMDIDKVFPKAEDVTITKEAYAPRKSSKTGLDWAAAGEEVDFTLYVTVPDYRVIEGRTFTVTDTMSDGLTLAQKQMNGQTYDNWYVTIDRARWDYTGLGSQYGTFTKDGNTLTWTLSEEGIEKAAGHKIQIHYTATIDTDASYEDVMTNQASTTFSKYNWGTEQETQSSNVVTITVYGAQFQKNDADGKGLPGAVFDVYKKGDTVDKDEPLIKGVTSDQNGLITIDGLASGDYFLHETSAPAGYALADDYSFTIAQNDTNGDGVFEGKQYDFTGTPIVDEDVSIISMLPTTGDAGTVAFTVAGVGIMAIAAAKIVRTVKGEN